MKLLLGLNLMRIFSKSLDLSNLVVFLFYSYNKFYQRANTLNNKLFFFQLPNFKNTFL
jgi:hypothetical protein